MDYNYHALQLLILMILDARSPMSFKPLRPDEVPPNTRKFLDFNNQFPDGPRNALYIHVTCPQCGQTRTLLSCGIRGSIHKGIPFTARCRSCQSGNMSRNYLTPDEVTDPDWLNYPGMDNQYPISGRLHMAVTCPNCGAVRITEVSRLRTRGGRPTAYSVLKCMAATKHLVSETTQQATLPFPYAHSPAELEN